MIFSFRYYVSIIIVRFCWSFWCFWSSIFFECSYNFIKINLSSFIYWNYIIYHYILIFPWENVLWMLYFDLRPGPKCHSRWCTGRKSHILMAVMRGNRVSGNWLMKWDELKIPWYSHRLTHRKRVISELHDGYFRLMTIKHPISMIERVIKWALNYYIAQSRQKSRQLELQ